MMKIKIIAKLGKTINLGNYESLRVDVGIEEEFNTDVEPYYAILYDRLAKSVNELLEIETKRQLRYAREMEGKNEHM